MRDLAAELAVLGAIVPNHAKALFAGRLHLGVLRERMEALRFLGGADPGPRVLEMYWVILNAMTAEQEGRSLSQKLLATHLNDMISSATISRSVRDAERQGWIVTRPSERDQRLRMIAPTDATRSYFLNAARAAASWSRCVGQVRLMCEEGREARVRLEGWLADLLALEPSARDRVMNELNVVTFDRLLRLLAASRGGPDFVRGQEAFWVVLETIMAHVENRSLAQKDLAALSSGLYSSSTLSRVVRDGVARGWVVSAPGDDGRVRLLRPTDHALAVFFGESQVTTAWRTYAGIFLRAKPLPT